MKQILDINRPDEALYYLKRELDNRMESFWRKKDGELINIKDMSLTHLMNTINLLEEQIEERECLI